MLHFTTHYSPFTTYYSRLCSIPFGLDDFRHGDAELVFHEHHFAACHQSVVDVDVDGFADLAVELEHRARTELEQVPYIHLRASEHRRDLDRHIEHRLKIRGGAILRIRIG